MTIKQQGGVFGRNPTFNDVEVEGNLTVGGSSIPAPADTLTTSDIGSTVQAYDADTAKYDDTTANFVGTLQNGGSNVLVDTDVGSTVQGYDADTTKNDVTNTFTAVQYFPNGSNSAPSLAPSGDTDTGVYFETGKVKVATGGVLRAQVEGANLTLGGTRQANGFEGRYPARVHLWGDASLTSSSVRLANYKTNLTSGTAEDIFTFTKDAGYASSAVYAQIGGKIKLSVCAQYTGGYDTLQFVEIPFSLGSFSTGNFTLATGTQTIVTSFNNISTPTFALSLSSTSNTSATLALTVTRASLLNNDIGIEIEAVGSADGSNRLPVVTPA